MGGPPGNGTHQTAFPKESMARFIADSSPRGRVCGRRGEFTPESIMQTAPALALLPGVLP
jgi:hypothetical protein